MIDLITQLLGSRADSLLTHIYKTIPKESIHIPRPDVVDTLFTPSDRNNRVLGNLQRI